MLYSQQIHPLPYYQRSPLHPPPPRYSPCPGRHEDAVHTPWHVYALSASIQSHSIHTGILQGQGCRRRHGSCWPNQLEPATDNGSSKYDLSLPQEMESLGLTFFLATFRTSKLGEDRYDTHPASKFSASGSHAQIRPL